MTEVTVSLRGNRAPPVNVSNIHVTMNTNKKISDSERNRVEDGYIDLLEDQLFKSPEAMAEVFGEPSVIKKVSLPSDNAFGFEEGSTYHRFHIHLNLQIEHYVPRYSLPKLAKRLTQWLNTHDTVLNVTRWYVHITSSDLRRINYANKEKRWENNDKIEGTDELSTELDRLSHDFTQMVSVTEKKTGGGNKIYRRLQKF